MGIFDGLQRTDADVAQQNVPTGFFAQMMAARGMPIGGRRAKRQQELFSGILNEEIEAGAGDATSVDMAKMLPEAYFRAARRIETLGNPEAAQKLYQAGVAARDANDKRDADLAKLKADTALVEAETEYTKNLKGRTGGGADGYSSAVAEQVQIKNEALAAEGKPPLTSAEINEIYRQASLTSAGAQVPRQTEGERAITSEQAGQVAASTSLGNEGIKGLLEFETQARAARTNIRSVGRSLEQLNEGLRTGTAANVRQWVARAVATFLGEDPSAETVNTDAFMATAGPRILAEARKLAPVTELDLTKIEQIVGAGLSNATPAALREVLQEIYMAQSSIIEGYNEQLAGMSAYYGDVKARAMKPITFDQIDFSPPQPSAPTGAPGQRIRIRVDENGNVVQ